MENESARLDIEIVNASLCVVFPFCSCRNIQTFVTIAISTANSIQYNSKSGYMQYQITLSKLSRRKFQIFFRFKKAAFIGLPSFSIQ